MITYLLNGCVSPNGEVMLPTLNLQQWDFFFVLAFVLGLYALHRLAMIKEEGEVNEKVFMNELFTEVWTQVRTLSSVDGIKQMVVMPIEVMKSVSSVILPKVEPKDK